MNFKTKLFVKRLVKSTLILFVAISLSKSILNLVFIKSTEEGNNFSNDIKIYETDDDNNHYNSYRRQKDRQIEGKIIKYNRRNDSFLNKSIYLVIEYTAFNKQIFCGAEIGKNYILDRHLNNKRTSDYLSNCKYKNCRFSCDKSLIRESDALLFHDSDLFKEKNELTLLENRNLNQVWILHSNGPNKLNSKYNKMKFNWTMSYYSNAELSYCTYGCFQKHPTKMKYDEFEHLAFTEHKRRQNAALWFVSNCINKLRLQYGGELANYFPIRIYGDCESHIQQFIRGANFKEIFHKSKNCKSDCETDLQMMNKFYLAFESANCSDYITESFWRSLEFGIIPVVFQPAKKYYEFVAPFHSFIHAQDFGFDMKRLAEYMVKVSSNFSLYLKYVEWKFKYKVLLKRIQNYRICELCAKLNNERSTMYYESISNWFNKKCHRKNLIEQIF